MIDTYVLAPLRYVPLVGMHGWCVDGGVLMMTPLGEDAVSE
jgi:hypothetical protein